MDFGARLRCRLCAGGLLQSYALYRVSTDAFGAVGMPAAYGRISGYFYAASAVRSGEVLAVAGELTEKVRHSYRMLAFDDSGAVGDLVSVGGAFYRMAAQWDYPGDCRIWELEVYAV